MSVFDIQDIRKQILSFVYPAHIKPGMRVQIQKKILSSEYIEGIILSSYQNKCKIIVDKNKNGNIFKCYIHIPINKIKIISSKIHTMPETQHSFREICLFLQKNKKST